MYKLDTLDVAAVTACMQAGEAVITINNSMALYGFASTHFL